MMYLPVIIMVIITWISAYASLFLKKGSSKFDRKHIFNIINKHIIIGVFLYGVGTLSYLILLRKNDLSLLYPLSALSYIWVLFISHHHLDEKMNKFKILGISLIIIGILFIIV